MTANNQAVPAEIQLNGPAKIVLDTLTEKHGMLSAQMEQTRAGIAWLLAALLPPGEKPEDWDDVGDQAGRIVALRRRATTDATTAGGASSVPQSEAAS